MTTHPRKQTISHELNPKTTNLEFFGPVGTLFITFAAPLTTYLLYFGCSEQAGGCVPVFQTLMAPTQFLRSLPLSWNALFDKDAVLIYLGWYALCIVTWLVLPGKWHEGVPLRTGERKTYKLNGQR